MKNREKLVFSILLLLLNATGAVGALVTTLQLNWFPLQEPALFLGGVVSLCVFSTFFWMKGSRKRMIIQSVVLFAVYCVCVFGFRRRLLNSLAWGLDGAVSKLNERYNIRLIWNWTMESDAEAMARTAALSVLLVLVPYIMLQSYGIMRSSITAIILADAVWFAASCSMDTFPAYRWVVLCVLGLAAVVIQKAYRDDERAGVPAVLFGMGVLGAVMIFAHRFMIPVFDQHYEAILEARIELHTKMNEEWIPKLQSSFSRFGIGEGVDVTGELTRSGTEAYTDKEVYRVTMDAAPKNAVYLRGFVGVDYTGAEWKPDKDSAFEKYYRSQGWELPESGGELINLTYEAFRRRSSGYVRIEELAGAGGYSLYPYGAGMTEDYKVHWDGSVERKDSIYEFPYCAPQGYDVVEKLVGVQAEEERRYRSYVYDNFCDYPEERFPELTAFLEESGFRRGDFYESLADVLSYLRQNASYNLEAGNPPEGEDFVEYFLFDSHQGYCAHFASAAVLMLRYLGVPARYATGYSVSANAFSKEADGSYTAVITDKQAHAWAEVYLDGVGWIPVEMTPGAVAFTRDNSLEQLELAGQLSGAFSDGEDVKPGEDNASGEPEETPGENPDNEPEESLPQQQPEPEKKPADSGSVSKPEQGEPGTDQSETGSPTADGSTADDDGEQGAALRKNPSPEWKLNPRVKAVLKGSFGVCCCLLLCYGAVHLIRLNCYRRLCRAGRREKIFLLYRNLKKLLRIAGHMDRLAGEDNETCAFRLILEKSSFGGKDPSEQELRRAIAFCRRVAKEEYGRLPFYRKPLYLCLNVYK